MQNYDPQFDSIKNKKEVIFEKIKCFFSFEKLLINSFFLL